MPAIELLVRDEFNARLLASVHPPDWKNPVPRPLYDLVVIGGGTAGLVSAAGAAGLGARVALVERHLLGGDCLNYGCVPSKALIRAARAAHEVRMAGQFGVRRQETGNREQETEPVDFAAVIARMRRLRAEISPHDSAQRFTGLGVDVFLGEASFADPQGIDVAGTSLRFKRCVIATGARAAIPDVPGLDPAGYLTNETIFSLTELPQRLVVLGGGPIGCELAQVFRRFGSQVTIVQRGSRLLPRDEPDAAAILHQQFRREGISIYYNAAVAAFPTQAEHPTPRLTVTAEGQEYTLEADAILVAAGRSPNVEGLDLAAAGIECTARGVQVNDFLQTTNPRIYAAGDIVGSHQFTHAADAMARICIQNAFFSFGPLGKKRLSRLMVPWTTYTDPEIAHIGLTPQAAAAQGVALDTYREDLSRIDRAILDGQTDGFAVIHCRRGTANVVGCTIVAAHAGEMISEVALLMTAGLKLGTLSRTIHCYPTQVEILKRLGDQYNKSRLTPRAAAILKTIIGWRT